MQWNTLAKRGTKGGRSAPALCVRLIATHACLLLSPCCPSVCNHGDVQQADKRRAGRPTECWGWNCLRHGH